MFRWIVAAVVLVGLVALFVIPRQSLKTSYVNGLPPYNQLPGREFILQRDCYVFKLKAAPSDWPYLGAHATVPDLPEAVDAKQVGADLPAVRLLEVVKVGEHFKIVSVRRDQRGSAVRISFELLFTDEAAHRYPRVDADWILDHAPEAAGQAPAILSDYAAPRYDR